MSDTVPSQAGWQLIRRKFEMHDASVLWLPSGGRRVKN